jgi:hypothetical protein
MNAAQEVFKRNFSLQDVGTRYEHLYDLLELYECAYEILMGKPVRSQEESAQVYELKYAIKLLRKVLESVADMDRKMFDLRRTILSLPKNPLMIEGGRGTPLNRETMYSLPDTVSQREGF